MGVLKYQSGVGLMIKRAIFSARQNMNRCLPAGTLNWLGKKDQNRQTSQKNKSRSASELHNNGVVLLQFQCIYQAASQITAGPSPSAHSLSQW